MNSSSGMLDDSIKLASIKNCPLHIVYKLETICLHPNCDFQKMMCRICFIESNAHIILHKDFIVKISNVLSEISQLVNQRFYQTRLKDLPKKKYIEQFSVRLDEVYERTEKILDEYIVSIQRAIEDKKKIIKEILDDEQVKFINNYDMLVRTLEQGVNYETNNPKTRQMFDDLVKMYLESEKIDDYSEYEIYIRDLTNSICERINIQQCFREERIKENIINSIQKFDITINKPPEIVISHKIYDIIELIDTKVRVENLSKINIKFTDDPVKSLLPKRSRLCPNYFYDTNAFPHLYFILNQELKYIKLQEVDQNPCFYSIKIGNSSLLKSVESFSQLTTPDGRLFISGGFDSNEKFTLDIFLEFNFQSKCFEDRASTHYDRYYHSMCYLDNKIFVIGGLQIDNEGSYSLVDVEYYDLKEDRWTLCAEMNVATHHSAVTTFKNKFIMKIGGFNGVTLLNDIEQYDVEVDIWKLLQVNGIDNFKFISQADCVPINNETIMIFGGVVKINNQFISGGTIFLKEDSNSSTDDENSCDSWTICLKQKYTMTKPSFYSMPKKSAIYNFRLYALSNSCHVDCFDGESWKQLI